MVGLRPALGLGTSGEFYCAHVSCVMCRLPAAQLGLEHKLPCSSCRLSAPQVGFLFGAATIISLLVLWLANGESLYCAASHLLTSPPLRLVAWTSCWRSWAAGVGQLVQLSLHNLGMQQRGNASSSRLLSALQACQSTTSRSKWS